MALPTFAQIQAKVSELGFFKLGVLGPSDFPLDGTALVSWLDAGYHADMGWMANHLDKRLNPALLMPYTQSILVVAMHYKAPVDASVSPEPTLKLARYAQGDDYHLVLKDRLWTLLTWLQTFEPTLKGRPLTDSAPVLEKALAVKAGIGWQGKHSNLITRDGGSWFLLAELLLSMPIPDAPRPIEVANFCGTCCRCIEACPTDAIVSPAVVDANRCISYWTIESKAEALPVEIAEKLDGWVFGCDICQEVCPWNHKSSMTTPVAEFLPCPETVQLTPQAIEAWTPQTFDHHFAKSPVQRTGLQGLKRNINALEQASPE